MALDKPNVRAACPKDKLEFIFFLKLCIKSTALGFIVANDTEMTPYP